MKNINEILKAEKPKNFDCSVEPMVYKDSVNDTNNKLEKRKKLESKQNISYLKQRKLPNNNSNSSSPFR